MKKVIRKTQNIKTVFILMICTILSVIGFSSCDLGLLGGVATYESLVEEEEDIYNERLIPKDDFFYVKVEDARSARRGDKFDYLMYARHEEPGVACKIPADMESSEDLYCMLDVLEGDLLFQDITLEYNVPENMCDYLEFKLPWHYNQKVGQGLTEIWSFTDDDGTFYYGTDPGEPTCNVCEDGTYNSADSSCRSANGPACASGTLACDSDGQPTCGSGNPAPTCADVGDVTPTPACSGTTAYCETGKATCGDAPVGGENNIRFDCEAKGLDLKDAGLSNCCFGKYTEYPYSKQKDENGIEFWKKGVDKEGEWGTDFNVCIGGMARVNPIGNDRRRAGIIAGDITLENVPYPEVYGDDEYVRKNGYDDTYQMEKIYTYVTLNDYDGYSGYRIYKSAGSANCWGDTDGPEGCETEDRSWPRAMYTNNGDLIIPSLEGHPFLTWSCLDKGLEVMHRIHLIVREWNTEDEFNAYQESGGSRGTANKNGEQDGCDAYQSDNWISYESECNDLPDVKDITSGDYIGIRGFDSNLELEEYPGISYQ